MNKLISLRVKLIPNTVKNTKNWLNSQITAFIINNENNKQT